MIAPGYRAQVDLLLRILPHIAQEDVFALKGGTAINLFVRDMPRLSVDIDLTYLPLEDRAASLQGISNALRRIRERLDSAVPRITATTVAQQGGLEAKLLCQLQSAAIMIEVNTVMRAHLWPTREMDVTQAAEDEFARSATIKVVSHAELYGGKLCAALDRQHPRDLFDIQQLFDHEGLSDEIRLGFIAALLSHSRPMHELLRPSFQDRRTVFAAQFSGMAIRPYTYDAFEITRERLVKDIHGLLTDDDRQLLLSVKRGEPDWALFPLPTLRTMPGVQWKLANILNLKRNHAKHLGQLKALEEALSG